MEFIAALFLIILSVAAGICATLVVQWYLLSRFIYGQPYVGPPEKPVSGVFRLPQSLAEALQSNDVPKKESCIALNLLFQFLFKELQHTQKVRSWFMKKLSLEFEELLTRTTTGKLFDKVTIRDICLGTQFPAIKSIAVKDAKINSEHQHIDTLDLCIDLEYSGGFQLSIDANMVLGKMAYLSVKVTHLSGLARLQFTREPYTHWSFSFYNDPVLELQVESQFQGRPLPQITSIIINQIRKAVKKKHTLPNYKLRYKPFFAKTVPGEDEYSNMSVCPGILQVSVIEVTRLMAQNVATNIYCSMAVDSLAWVEVVHSETASYMTLDLSINKLGTQQLGFIFRQEYVAERYQACVVVDSVTPNSPAALADIRPDDILVAIDGKRVNALAQVARLIRSAAEKFTVRIERQTNYRIHPGDGNISKEGEKETDSIKVIEAPDYSKLSNTPMLIRDGLRRRKGSEDKTESDSSSSSPASMPGSPARKPSLFTRSSQSSPEHKHKPLLSLGKNEDLHLFGDKEAKLETESDQDYLQIHRTKELPYNQVLVFDETLKFNIQSKHRYLNVSVWSKSIVDSKTKQGRDTLLGHVSIPLAAVSVECSTNKLGHYITNYSLLPPDPHIALSNNSKLSSHSGFEPCLCYGDILLSFVYITPNGPPLRQIKSPQTPVEASPTTPVLLHPTHDATDHKKQHDFVRTQFNRTTQCEFCGKKIWLKDAVQCRTCSMTCHKKCVAKCQVSTVCSQRRASAQPEDFALPVPVTQVRRASAQPEIITTAADDDDEQSTQASLINNPFHFPHNLLNSESGDDVSAALDHLLQHPNDEDLMAIAKSTGKDLYCNFSLPERKEKINKLITNLKAAIDAETQSRMALAREENETKDPAAHTRIAFLIGKSDEKVQALAVLMLHCCAGLQHTRELEDALIKNGTESVSELSMETTQ